MPITQDSAVTLHIKVSDATTGQLIEAAKEPMAYLHGGYENTLPKIEQALDGQEAGFQTTLTLAASKMAPLRFSTTNATRELALHDVA